jgi:hypothetical protein
MAVAGTALHDGVGGLVLVDAVRCRQTRTVAGVAAVLWPSHASHRHALGLGLVRSVYWLGCVGP